MLQFVFTLVPEGSGNGVPTECAVRFEPVCANMGFFAISTKCFRAGLVVGK